mmetsp:Transcript_34998/g.67273  ORF Transcript_34998/g.67273 Transcript_34998/m.67273 type:complete len:404 (+) Transcript_34998:239-1450(+)
MCQAIELPAATISPDTLPPSSKADVAKEKKNDGMSEELYTWVEPEATLGWRRHFSSLLLSADPLITGVETLFLATLAIAAHVLPSEKVDVPGSMRLRELAAYLITASLFRRFYNSYLEAVYFASPSRRTQPPKEHALKGKRADLCGRDMKQLETLVYHDRLTMLSQLALTMTLYYAVPGMYPAPKEDYGPMHMRVLRLVGHHYLLSFGMYSLHRACHVVPFLWRHVHAIHHWATHPLSRNTYQDHWFDNFGNAIIGEVAAQILLPIDNSMFWFSRLFRIMESLEKHAGVMGYTNIAHSMQKYFPFAQMPHHHDWHHEGHKSCNFTFSSIGGIWDVVFGTRKVGRALRFPEHATRRDLTDASAKPSSKATAALFDSPMALLTPVFGVLALAAMKLHASGCVIKA